MEETNLNNSAAEAAAVLEETAGLGDSSGLEDRYLTFWANGQLFGVAIAEVEQIVGIQKILDIPDFLPYAKGMINLRGTMIPVVDVRQRLGMPGTEYDDKTCVIVMDIKKDLSGLIVDSVDEVTGISKELVSEPPRVGAAMTENYLSGVAHVPTGEGGAEKIILLLDSARVLGEE